MPSFTLYLFSASKPKTYLAYIKLVYLTREHDWKWVSLSQVRQVKRRTYTAFRCSKTQIKVYSQIHTCWWCERNSQEITKVITNHPDWDNSCGDNFQNQKYHPQMAMKEMSNDHWSQWDTACWNHECLCTIVQNHQARGKTSGSPNPNWFIILRLKSIHFNMWLLALL